jgi:hypothetical protein
MLLSSAKAFSHSSQFTITTPAFVYKPPHISKIIPHPLSVQKFRTKQPSSK